MVGPPRGAIPLQIEASIAFGTGRHETTRGCLLALDRLARSGRRIKRPLDLGCGSGVLALAMAHLWEVPVLAVDTDLNSVAVARENLRINRAGRAVAVVRVMASEPPPCAAPRRSISSSPTSWPGRCAGWRAVLVAIWRRAVRPFSQG